MRRLVVLRPEPAASQTAERARTQGLNAIAVPLFALEPVDWSPPGTHDFDGILFTSANAVNIAGEGMEALRSLPVHAVGEATAVAARVAGLGVATVGTGGIDQLLADVEPNARLLHLCGEDRRPPLRASQEITCRTVYRARALPDPKVLEALFGQVGAVHSPRAAKRLAELIDEKQRANVSLAAISPATADAAGSGWREIQCASAPTDSALLALAARMCDS